MGRNMLQTDTKSQMLVITASAHHCPNLHPFSNSSGVADVELGFKQSVDVIVMVCMWVEA